MNTLQGRARRRKLVNDLYCLCVRNVMHQYIRHKIIPAVNRPSRSRAQVRVRPVVSYGTVLPSSTAKAAKLRPAAMVKTACLLSVTKVETVKEWTNLSKDRS